MNRYAKQIQLKDFGTEGQARLRQSRVLIVGLGGLGLPAASYLNAMGAGTLGLIDGDSVELSNLHRQVLYTEEDIGRLKVEAAAEKLSLQNKNTAIRSYTTHLTAENALEICANYDVIIDASDNFGTRYLVNDTAVILDIPYVYAALHGWEGQLSVFNYQGGPTYRCVFPNPPALGSIPNCDAYGVLGVLPGILGAMQGLEAIKICLNLSEVSAGKLLLYNSLHNSMESILLPEKQESSERSELAEEYHIACPSKAFITSEEFGELLEKNRALQIIDVRTPSEYNADHLPGSLNVPLDTLEEAQSRFKWENTYLLCQSGTRSQLAQHKLKDLLGGIEIPYVQGGLNELSALCS